MSYLKLPIRAITALFISLSVCFSVQADANSQQKPLTSAMVLEQSQASDWRTPDQAKLLYLTLENGGQVVFELATDFAPNVIKNIAKLTESNYFDGLAVIRSQDNYVAQWGDPNSGTDKAKELGDAAKKLDAEFFRASQELQFNSIESRDAYADQVGFSKGFAVGLDDQRAWLTHCYGTIGVGRGYEQDSGTGAELYVVTGHAPRHLDRNVTLIGRALSGMSALSSLKRGTGTLGFYQNKSEHVAIKSIRLGNQINPADQLNIEIMRTDTQTFQDFVAARTTRLEEWFIDPAGRIGLCNVAVPSRAINAAKTK